jgi:hypothetical protein
MEETANAIAVEGDMISILRTTAEFSVEAGDGDNLNFRVEIFEFEGNHAEQPKFRARVWRYETFRLLPLNAVARGELFDHTCLVLDDMFDGLEVTASSPEDAFIICRNKIYMQLGVVD